MPLIKVEPADRRVEESTYLSKFARNVFSQGGEDGVIEEVFRIIGATNKWCVEFGAYDGEFLSNTCNLIRNHGWRSVHIEGDPELAQKIRSNHPGNDKVIPVCAMVGFQAGVDTIDDLIKDTGIPKNFDFISIDVDGIDWHIWESIVEHRPRVVIIEYNPTVPNDVVFVQDRDMGINEGCSIAALIELGKRKSYELIALTGLNAIFVVAEEFAKFNIKDNSIHAMRRDRPNYVWNCYNGKVYTTMPRMNWYGKNVPVYSDSLQLLAEFRFHGRNQGRAGERHLRQDASARSDLSTAFGILMEIYELRSARNTIDAATHAARTKAAWTAAKILAERNRSWASAPAEEPGKAQEIVDA